MMNCVLTKNLPQVHKDLKDDSKKRGLAESFVMCPLFNDRQICVWCCLHIVEQANPNKQFAAELNPHYEKLTDQIGKHWEEVWGTCGPCGNNTDR